MSPRYAISVPTCTRIWRCIRWGRSLPMIFSRAARPAMNFVPRRCGASGSGYFSCTMAAPGISRSRSSCTQVMATLSTNRRRRTRWSQATTICRPTRPRIYSTFCARSKIATSIQFDVGERQGGCAFDRLECKACAHILERDACNEAFVDDVVGVDVRHHDAHEIIDIAAHPIDLGDLRDLAHRTDELLEPGGAMVGRLQRHENRGSDVDRARIKERHRLPDDAILLQLPDAPPARRLGKAHPIGNGGCGQRPVLLQEIQNFPVELI